MFRYSDKQLALGLRDPERRDQTFKVLVHQYNEKIYWFVRRMVLDYDDARDVTQIVFIKAWEHVGEFQFQCSIFTWLYRIATNESLNHLRKKCREAKISLEEAGDLLSQYIDHGNYISGEDIYIRLERAVASLPEKQRTVFILRYFEDRAYSEIATITGSSEGSLHASYHLAVKKIENILKETDLDVN